MVPIFAVPVFNPIATFSNNSNTIYSSVYDSGFPTATDVPTGTLASYTDIYTSYNSQTGETIATWINLDSEKTLFYAVFNGTVWSESQPMFESVFQAYRGVYTTYNPITNVTVATFSDLNEEKPYYSVYNNGIWSEPLELFEGDQRASNIIYTAFNPISGNIVGAFQDGTDGVYYTFYDGVNWTPSSLIAH
jgi:hypothetical protein